MTLRRVLPALACILLGASGHRATLARITDDEWWSYGRDFTNQRYSPLAQLNTANVGSLTLAWTHDTRPAPPPRVDGLFKQESSPIIVDGVLYYTYPGPQVFALDAATGRELWRFNATGNAEMRVCCGPNNRGVAVSNGLVFVATLDARVVALDAKTGKPVWETRAAEGSRGYSFTMAPLVADGKVIVGVAGGEFEIRGFVDAYDAKTGARIWRFWTVPSPDEGGWWGTWATRTPDGDPMPRDIARERADSARYPDAWQRGGAPVWTTPSYDAELGLVYFGTGNPGADYDDHERPGDNLFSNSIVAVDIKTGKHRWHYQTVPHDLWDYDLSGPTVLVDAIVNGARVPAIAHAGKTGWVNVLDRRNGRRIVRSEEFVPHENMWATPTVAGVRIAPGIQGGANWQPMSYSPRTGLLYVRAQHSPNMYRRIVSEHVVGERYDGGIAYAVPRESFVTTTAIEPGTGKIKWQTKTDEPGLGSPLCGGSMATAGDLVFYGDPRGFLNAVDARTGETLWKQQTGSWARATPVTYRIGDRQYVALTTLQGLLVYALPPK
jgi:PQQ-dependent dehydrogenase (methanol/ethanol family)